MIRTYSTTFSTAARFTLVFSVLVALILPVGYGVMAYQHLKGSMESSAEFNSQLVSGLIAANPQLWRFETIRIEELLLSRTSTGIAESRRIYDVNNVLVAAKKEKLWPPLATFTREIVDNGDRIGRIEVSRSLLPILLISLLLAFVGMVIGISLYRWLPFQSVIEAGRQLQDANDILTKVMEGSANAIAVIDLAGQVTLFNGNFEKMSGCAREEIAGFPVIRMFTGTALPQVEAALHDVSTGNRGDFMQEVLLSRLDGVEFNVVIRAVPLYSMEKVCGVVLSLEDITSRKLTERKLQKRTNDMEQFIYSISHDLRTPLVTIKTFMGYLESDMDRSDRERIIQDLQFIHAATDKMKLMLDELLEISRIDRTETQHVRVLLSEVLTEVLETMAGIIDEREVVIRRPDTDLMVHLDRQRFCQVWQNLIENAIKYSFDDRPPLIELGLRQESGETVFYVKDCGMGIDPSYHSRIFGLFEKLDSKSQGAGLGLSMVKRIVEQLGGRIWVESEGVGKGSCFFFTLPGSADQD
jgi:PAS domain S-box-containing protein